MSITGETDGQDLTVETLQFIEDNWAGIAQSFSLARDDAGNVWQQPVLRNGDDKTLHSDDSIHGYDAALRNNDVVTVEEQGRNDDVVGTKFDFDVEWELDVRVEALNNGFTVVEDSTDWRVFTSIVRRCILARRRTLPTDPSCKFDWRWLTFINASTIPEAADNRDRWGREVSLIWHGFERNPGGLPANTAFDATFAGAFIG